MTNPTNEPPPDEVFDEMFDVEQISHEDARAVLAQLIKDTEGLREC